MKFQFVGGNYISLITLLLSAWFELSSVEGHTMLILKAIQVFYVNIVIGILIDMPLRGHICQFTHLGVLKS